MKDLYLDLSGALGVAPQLVAYGRITCDTAQGLMALAATGTFLNLQSGFFIAIYFLDFRLVCTLDHTTLSAPVCDVYNIASGLRSFTLGLTYVP